MPAMCCVAVLVAATSYALVGGCDDAIVTPTRFRSALTSSPSKPVRVVSLAGSVISSGVEPRTNDHGARGPPV